MESDRSTQAWHAGALALLVAAGTAGAPPPAVAADAQPWPVAGQQGLVRFIIVPTAQAADRAAYLKQIALLCEPDRTCFLNFYTNPTNAPVSMPLPDAIDKEATAVFRRSMKQQAELLSWSCRLQVPGEPCF